MEITKLAAADRPKQVYRYRVSGSGSFPIDMLRYDCAYPASADAAVAIGARSTGHGAFGVRTVELRSHHPPKPARWESFGWKVIE